MPGSGRGRRSVISGGDRDERLATAVAGTKVLFFAIFAPLWRIVNDVFFFLFFFPFYIFFIFFFLIDSRVLVIYFVLFYVFVMFSIILKDLPSIF